MTDTSKTFQVTAKAQIVAVDAADSEHPQVVTDSLTEALSSENVIGLSVTEDEPGWATIKMRVAAKSQTSAEDIARHLLTGPQARGRIGHVAIYGGLVKSTVKAEGGSAEAKAQKTKARKT